jgi:hypothetical protein
VLEEQLLPSAQVRFFGMCDYRGGNGNGHHFVSTLTGDKTTVKVRRKFVDATYVESSIPSRHTPAYEVDADVRLVSPNDLVNLSSPAGGYTVIGAGKTSMDTCNWLLDEGVEPDTIRWIKPRDGWLFNRAFMQPLEMVASYTELQARWVQAAAEASSGADFASRLEAHDVFVRLDPSVEPGFFRGAIVSPIELDSLRRIENVVRGRKVRRIATDRITFEQDSIPSDPRQIYVDCTAAGVRPTQTRPIFEPNRVTLQYVTIGIVPWGAATIGFVEATRDDDVEKNRLCPPLTFTGNVSDVLTLCYSGMSGLMARAVEPDLAAWTEASRLNPGRGAADHMDDPRVPAAFASLGAHLEPAMSNLERLVGAVSASAVT